MNNEQRRKVSMNPKEKLVCQIEEARKKLDKSIDKDETDIIYQRSVELDQLIEQYIVAGY
jgi:hypothetical protein